MFQRIFFAAIVAGLLAGALISGVQSVTTIPIILDAEEYEGGGQDHSATSPGVNSIQLAVFDAATGKLLHRIGESAPAANKEEGWAPEDGLERVERYFRRLPLVVQGGLAGLGIVAIDAMGPDGVAPFIYFQF